MESTKEIALELLFLEGSKDKMRLLRIPRRSSSADVENLDAALWAIAQMDSDIRHDLVSERWLLLLTKHAYSVFLVVIHKSLFMSTRNTLYIQAEEGAGLPNIISLDSTKSEKRDSLHPRAGRGLSS